MLDCSKSAWTEEDTPSNDNLVTQVAWVALDAEDLTKLVLVSTGSDGIVRVWNPKNGELLQSLVAMLPDPIEEDDDRHSDRPEPIMDMRTCQFRNDADEETTTAIICCNEEGALFVWFIS